MLTTHRSYSDASGDFARLARFVMEHNHAVRTYSTWCLGRLVDWRYAIFDHKDLIQPFCDANAHLWFNSFGDLVAFAVSESGDAEFTLITAAGYRSLFEEMLGWAQHAWADRGPGFRIEVTENQQPEIRVLERAGFHCEGTYYFQFFDLTGDLPPRGALEDGFTIVDMASHPDYRAQRRMRAEAFSGIDSIPDEALLHELERVAYYHAGPTYNAATDLCVMAPDGAFVAGCEALIDAWNLEADIERVCTHSAYRRRGFARAAIQECLYRLKEMGLHRAAIMGYSQGALALYASIGASREMAFHTYQFGE